MKQLISIVLIISVLASCGPHRMRCGERGICKAPDKTGVTKIENSKLPNSNG